jgi:hypothetical protein
VVLGEISVALRRCDFVCDRAFGHWLHFDFGGFEVPIQLGGFDVNAVTALGFVALSGHQIGGADVCGALPVGL